MFSINKVSLVKFPPVDTGSIRDDPYLTCGKNSLELIELSSINNVSLVQISFCSNARSMRDEKAIQHKKSQFTLFSYSRDIFPVTLKMRQDDNSLTIPFSTFEFSQVTSSLINFPSISDFLPSERSSIIFN